jgi:hypothetical protein
MARKRSANEKAGMTVYPPLECAAVLGAFKTRELTVAVNCATHVLGVAAVEVAGTFSPGEWGLIASVLEDKVVDHDLAEPGPALGQMVETACARFGLAAADALPAPLADRLRALTYAQAWAVLISLRFRKVNARHLEPGMRWWDVGARWQAMCQSMRQEQGEK